MTNIVLASGNIGKIKVLTKLCHGTDIKVVPQSDFNVPEAAETGLTYVENAILKARNACEYTKMPAIADDSGIEVDALNGAPGLYSARYAGEKAPAGAHIDKLLNALTQINDPKARSARFQCVVVYLERADDPSPIICQGTWEGQIAFAPDGEQGFGYDPVFYLPEEDCTAAKLADEDRIYRNHRGQAFQKLIQCLSK